MVLRRPQSQRTSSVASTIKNLLFVLFGTSSLSYFVLWPSIEVEKLEVHTSGTRSITNYEILPSSSDPLRDVTIIRSGTVPPFLLALKQSGTNSDFLNYGKNFYGGVYHNGHEPITALFQHLLTIPCQRSACVGDVGSNAGYYTQLFLSMGCQVRTFEVQKELVRLIQIGAWLNSAGDRLKLKWMAASDQEGMVHILGSGWEGGNTAVLPGEKHDGKEDRGEKTDLNSIPAGKLDNNLFDDSCRHIVALKLDVEGSEIKTFAGLSDALQDRSIDNILFEFGGKHWKNHGYDLADGVRTLKTIVKAGYDVLVIDMHSRGSALSRKFGWAQEVYDTSMFGGEKEVRTYLCPEKDLESLVEEAMIWDINLWARVKQ